MLTIDIHSHFFPPSWPDFGRRFGTNDWPWLDRRHDGHAVVMIDNREFRKIDATTIDPVARVEALERDGVDLQIVCATPVMFSYHRPVEQALEVARFFNDAALEFCAKGNKRLLPMCQVPLQDTDVACAELDRCLSAGHVGVQIGNHVGPRDLDDDELVRFLRHCADAGAPVFVHPWDMLGQGRTSRFMMGWTVSMPTETHLSICTMILGGAFDRLPESLKICFAHGGGSFPYLLGRLENAWQRQVLTRGTSTKPPSQYVHRFCVDSAVFDPVCLRFLVEIMGEDRIMLGSDYPYPLGEGKVGHLIRNSSDLSEKSKKKLLADNAMRFFGLKRGQDDSLAAVNE